MGWHDVTSFRTGGPDKFAVPLFLRNAVVVVIRIVTVRMVQFIKIAVDDFISRICCCFPFVSIIILWKQICSVRIPDWCIHRISIEQITCRIKSQTRDDSLAGTFGCQSFFCTGSPVGFHVWIINQRVQFAYYIVDAFIPRVAWTFQFGRAFSKVEQLIMKNEYRSVDAHHQEIVVGAGKTCLHFPLFSFIVGK